MGAYDHGNISAIAERRKTRRIHVGPVPIGDGAPVVVQSMTTTQTADVEATLAQIRALAAEGADVVRVAVPDAEAAHCAGEQGKYWEMHAKLFANQRALDTAALKGYAKDLKLDQAKFDKCLDSGATASIVEEGRKAGTEAGINGTPAFFVNGILISGAQPFDAFKEVIDAELAQK